MSSLISQIELALAEAGLLTTPRKTIVVAISGGPDSLALLHALHCLNRNHSVNLHAAHLNHGLRGEESDGDAKFVQEQCQALAIPLSTSLIDWASVHDVQHLPMEAILREKRYSFLAQVVNKVGASCVVTGHTADDQAETVLLHLLRGSGISGLRGMLPVTEWHSHDKTQRVSVVRPLLQVTRKETEGFCSNLKITPRQDSSNMDLQFTRNSIRHSLIPVLSRYNPAISKTLNHLAKSATRDIEHIDVQVNTAWPTIVVSDDAGIQIQRSKFLELSPSLQTHLLRRAYNEISNEANTLTYDQLEKMLNLARNGAGKYLYLPNGLRFYTDYQYLSITTDLPSPRLPTLKKNCLHFPGDNNIQGWLIRIHDLGEMCRTRIKLVQDQYVAKLDADKIGKNLWVRSREQGDLFHPLGMIQHKKLKNFMIDARIPRYDRDSVPLVVSENGIVWVVGNRIADWAKVTKETSRVLEITFTRS